MDEAIFEQVANALKVTPEAIKNFDKETAANYFNSFHDNSTAGGFGASNHNFYSTTNPPEKIIELYEALVKSEKEKVDILQRMLEEKK